MDTKIELDFLKEVIDNSKLFIVQRLKKDFNKEFKIKENEYIMEYLYSLVFDNLKLVITEILYFNDNFKIDNEYKDELVNDLFKYLNYSVVMSGIDSEDMIPYTVISINNKYLYISYENEQSFKLYNNTIYDFKFVRPVEKMIIAYE